MSSPSSTWPSLESWGWNSRWERVWRDAQLPPEAFPGRVVCQQEESFLVEAPTGRLLAYPAGVLFHQTAPQERPGVGDWVVLESHQEQASGGDLERIPQAVVQGVLPRSTLFLREAPGQRGEAQVVAANVDAVYLCMAADQVNLNRVERFLVAICAAGSQPRVLLSKADLVEEEELEVRLDEIRGCMPGLTVLATSRPWDQPEAVRELFAGRLESAHTYALVGASGAGKSTLLNALADSDLQEVGEIREGDGKGRHVTTFRHLFRLPGGALVMDTPGMRELALWTEQEALAQVFPELFEASDCCRFSNCTHGGEPGCAVQAGLDSGVLSRRRSRHLSELQRELQESSERRDARESRRQRTSLLRKQRRGERFGGRR